MGVPLKTCYSMESSQSLKARNFLQAENINDGCKEYDILNS
jgi:hypothetical protein